MNEKPDANFESLLMYLQQSRGFDFSGYKRASLMRRVRKQMQAHDLADFADYVDFLEVHPEEFAHLFNTILINVTSFFRDVSAWECVAQDAIDRIVADKKQGETLRVWCAGCASGEEAYTVAMLLAEAMNTQSLHPNLKIYATDVDEDALAQARLASYSARDVEAVPEKFRDKYFENTGTRYIVRGDLRRSVIFGRHDLVQDAPISHLDLLVSRNTLMYFNAETQSRILTRLHFALNDTGFIFLGKAEMLLTHTALFTPVDLKCRLFKKVAQYHMRDRILALAQAGNVEAANGFARQVRLREVAFDSAPVAQIAVDSAGILCLANDEARRLFGLNGSDIDRPLQDLEISYRPIELRSLIDQALSSHQTVIRNTVECKRINGDSLYVDVHIVPLHNNGAAPLGASVSFLDVTRNQLLRQELEHSKQEVETASEELQSTNEELETTNEELQSTVEELETTNEELQSTNEELETMNEELQSSNEELQTVNEELRQRTEELNNSNSFLESILTSLHTGVVVTNRNLAILIWNQRSEDLWGLRGSELQGESFLNLDIGLPVENLKAPLRAIVAEESDYEESVLPATNRRGKAIQCRVVCSPFVDRDKLRRGVILLMEEMEKQ